MSLKVAVLPKGMFASRTFWLNLLVGLVAMIGEVQTLLPSFSDILVLPATTTRWLLLATAVANIILRRISDEPARFTPDKAVPLQAAPPAMPKET